MILKVLTFCLLISTIASIDDPKELSSLAHGSKSRSGSGFNATYIEIDHELVPRKIEDINDMSPLPVPEGRDYSMKKYKVAKRQIQDIILELEKNKENDETKKNKPSKVNGTDTWKDEAEIRKSKLKSVIGSKGGVYYDEDWGLMGAILACYNNHWVLRTGPEDWWTVVVRRIAQAIDKHGDVPQVREFFVEHKGKKKLEVIVGSTLSNIDYNWLFLQFSKMIRKNIKIPNFVNIIENDFSRSTAEQKVISNIMMMSSMKKYFRFGIGALCGIPGIEMKGSEQDWNKLVDKLKRMEELLAPINQYLELTDWFKITETVFKNLLDTYKGQPNIEWWTRILTWNERWGSGKSPPAWTGWFLTFFGTQHPWWSYSSSEFPSDLVTVPLHISDFNNPPPVEDDGILVAGIVGFKVEEGQRAPVVEPAHVWSLLLPEGSPVAERLKGGYIGSSTEMQKNGTHH